MNNSLNFNNQTYDIEYYPAKVMHSDKYSERDIFFSNSAFAYTPKHDISFKENHTGREFFFTVEFSRINAYVGQEVELITLDKKIIGYLSNTSNDYYYLTNRFAQIMGMSIDWKWMLLVIVMLGSTLFFIKDHTYQQYVVISLFVIPVLYWTGMRVFNLHLERRIDKVISEG